MDLKRSGIYRKASKYLTSAGKRKLRRQIRRDVRELRVVLESRLSGRFIGRRVDQCARDEILSEVSAVMEEYAKAPILFPKIPPGLEDLVRMIGSRPIVIRLAPSLHEIEIKGVLS